MFLTHEELIELTGYKRPDKQREWLRLRAYPFELDARDRPKVLRAAVERRLGARMDTPREPKLRLP